MDLVTPWGRQSWFRGGCFSRNRSELRKSTSHPVWTSSQDCSLVAALKQNRLAGIGLHQNSRLCLFWRHRPSHLPIPPDGQTGRTCEILQPRLAIPHCQGRPGGVGINFWIHSFPAEHRTGHQLRLAKVHRTYCTSHWSSAHGLESGGTLENSTFWKVGFGLFQNLCQIRPTVNS